MDNLAALIELAIGLVFVYIALSLACSQIQEIIARMLNWRAQQLEDALIVMITNPEKVPGLVSRIALRLQELARVNRWPEKLGALWARLRGTAMPDIPSKGKLFIAELYAHPLIKALTRPGARIGPEYMPASSFSLALFNTLMRAGSRPTAVAQAIEQLRARLLAAVPDPHARAQLADTLSNAFNPLLIRIAALPQNVTPQTSQELLQDFQKVAAGYPALRHALAVEQLRLGIEAQKSQFPDLYRGLETLLHEAETDTTATEELFGATRAKVETWYDSTMDRATVWYKQRIQWWLFGIGFAVALIVNADSIRIADALWREPTLRQAVAEQARLAAAAQPAAASSDLGAVINKLNTDLTALNIPIGWRFTPVAVAAGRTCSPFTWLPVVDHVNEVTGLPINGGCQALGEAPRDVGGALLKILGLAISGLAAMQGAPFWFDLLQKLVNVGQSTRREKA